MYIEFVIIYILLVVLIALAVVNLVFMLKNKGGNNISFKNENQQPVEPVKTSASPSYNANQGDSVVFCINCATQYSSSEKCCPNCGTPRS